MKLLLADESSKLLPANVRAMVIKDVLATSNEIENLQCNLESVIDFFLAPISKLYVKLCEDSMKLLFECEFRLDYYRKAEEVVWRRIYHDVYKFRKNRRELIKEGDAELLESHFISGIGFYSNLIVKLRLHYGIHNAGHLISPLSLSLCPLEDILEDHTITTAGSQDNLVDKQSNDQLSTDDTAPQAKEWALHAIYRSLVYMGDLARYLLETSQTDYRPLAIKFYKTALLFEPTYGLPFNQLGTLAGNVNYNLDAIFNYICCCMRLRPFEGGEGNIRKIFDASRKAFNDMSQKLPFSTVAEVFSCKDPSYGAELLMQKVIVVYINLISDLWNAITTDKSQATNNLVSPDDVVVKTKIFFEHFREALELEPLPPFVSANYNEQPLTPILGGFSNPQKPKYISPTIMFEFCCIPVMMSAKCQRIEASTTVQQPPIDAHYVDLINTLALNLLHYAVATCKKVFINKIQEFRIRQAHTSEARLKPCVKHCRSLERSSPAFSESSAKLSLSKQRQKKATRFFNDASLVKKKESVRTYDDSDMSELEETALSTIDALDIGSDMSESVEAQVSDLIDFGSSSEDVSGCFDNLNVIDSHSAKKLRNDNHNSDSCLTTNVNNEFENLSCKLATPTLHQDVSKIPDLLTGEFVNHEQPTMRSVNKSSFAISQTNLVIDSPAFTPECSKMNISLQASSLTDLDDNSSSSKKLGELKNSVIFVYTKTYLPSIKIFCDWLLTNGEIITSNIDSFGTFKNDLNNLVRLLKEFLRLSDDDRRSCDMNISTDLNQTEKNACLSSQKLPSINGCNDLIFKHVYSGPSWVQKYPLSIDQPLIGLASLKTVHDLNIDFSISQSLNEAESGFLTVQCIEAFSRALATFLDNKQM